MHENPISIGELLPEHVNKLSRNFWNSTVLRADIKLGVFSLLENQSLSAPEVTSHPGTQDSVEETLLLLRHFGRELDAQMRQ